MSLILDALRKMEQDRRSRQGTAQDIRPEVLRYRAPVKPQQAKPYLLVTLCLVVLAAGIGTGAFLMGERDLAATQAVTPAAALPPGRAPALPAASAAAPAGGPAATSALSAPAALPAAVLAAPAGEPAPGPAPLEPSRAKPARKPVAAAARPASLEAAARPQAKAPHREPAEDAAPIATDITISGIAYQDERSLRRAVLNGSLVGEGAEVAGARVVEIRENKVRMSRGGQVFDVVFSSGLQPR